MEVAYQVREGGTSFCFLLASLLISFILRVREGREEEREG